MVLLSELDAVFAARVAKWLAHCDRRALGVYLVSGYRSYDTQREVYDDLHPKGARVATPGRSCHEVSAAVDAASTFGYASPQWSEAAALTATYGLDHPFPALADDPGHIEMSARCRVLRVAYVPRHDDGSPLSPREAVDAIPPPRMSAGVVALAAGVVALWAFPRARGGNK